MTKSVKIFYPYKFHWIDSSQIEKGFPDHTDFLSWLLTNIGYANYSISFKPSPVEAKKGWNIEFKNSKDALLFKLTWM